MRHRAYSYRADGNLTAIEDQLAGSRRFELDPTGRVTAVQAANWTERYAYDEAGNQTSASWPTSHPGGEATGSRDYTGTRITRAGRVRYEHDALGRTTLRQKSRLSRKPDTWHYAWDAEDRLTSVITPDGTRWSYSYDPLGRRTAKRRLAADGETVTEEILFAWDGTTLCEQTTRSASLPNPVTLTWNHRGLHPITQSERITAADAPQHEIDSRFFAIVTDLVGTPSELVDEQGDIAWRTRSTLWGTTTWPTSSTAYTPSASPASTTTRKQASTTTTSATTIRKQRGTSRRTHSVWRRPSTSALTWLTRSHGATHWVWHPTGAPTKSTSSAAPPEASTPAVALKSLDTPQLPPTQVLPRPSPGIPSSTEKPWCK